MKKKKATKKQSSFYGKIRFSVNQKEKSFIQKQMKEKGFVHMTDFVRYKLGI